MTDEKKNKHAQNAEILMWLAFISCGIMIALVEEKHLFSLFSEEEASSKMLPLIEKIAWVWALLLCFPPLHRRKLQNSATPFKDVGLKAMVSFLLVGMVKGVLII